MIRKLRIYDYKIIMQDDDFRKYKKIYLLEVDLNGYTYPVDTIIDLGCGRVARITRVIVDVLEQTEYYEAVALGRAKWV